MSTTKPARQRPHTPPRKAPTYQRVPPDTYANLEPDEQRRHDAHLDIDAAFDALPYARLDQRSHGFPTTTRPANRRTTNNENLNTVEAASQQPNPANDWLNEYTKLRAILTRVARLARYHYGFDPDRERPEPGRPQHRHNQIPLCAWCQQPAPEGRDDKGRNLVRRVDGQPVHSTPCYWDASNQARATGTTVAANIHNRATNLPTHLTTP